MARLGATDEAAAWNVQLPQVREAVERQSFRFAGSTNTRTTLALDDAIARLRQELAQGMIEGPNTIAELTKRVNAVFDGLERSHARLIAQTESARAVHAGQKIAAEQSGMVAGFQWLLSAAACPQCAAVAAEHPDGVGLGGAFADDGMGGPYSVTEYPPLHPRCMCTVTEVLKPLDEVLAGVGWESAGESG